MKDAVLSIARHVFSILGGIAVAKGYADESAVVALSGAFVTIVAVGWEYFATGKLSAQAKA